MRYLCIMEITHGKPKRLLGTNIYTVDGRVSSSTALLRGMDWATKTAAYYKLSSYSGAIQCGTFEFPVVLCGA